MDLEFKNSILSLSLSSSLAWIMSQAKPSLNFWIFWQAQAQTLFIRLVQDQTKLEHSILLFTTLDMSSYFKRNCRKCRTRYKDPILTEFSLIWIIINFECYKILFTLRLIQFVPSIYEGQNGDIPLSSKSSSKMLPF